MSHLHFCDIAGHLWECRGKALCYEAVDLEPPLCICVDCQLPMDGSDHSDCSIELIACPEHINRQRKLSKDGTPDGLSTALFLASKTTKKSSPDLHALIEEILRETSGLADRRKD